MDARQAREVLGLSAEDARDEAKRRAAYKRRALETHPDKNGGTKEAEERFKEVSRAFDYLEQHAGEDEDEPSRRGAAPQAGQGWRRPPQGAQSQRPFDGFATPFDADELFGFAWMFSRMFPGVADDGPVARRAKTTFAFDAKSMGESLEGTALPVGHLPPRTNTLEAGEHYVWVKKTSEHGHGTQSGYGYTLQSAKVQSDIAQAQQASLDAQRSRDAESRHRAVALEAERSERLAAQQAPDAVAQRQARIAALMARRNAGAQQQQQQQQQQLQ